MKTIMEFDDKHGYTYKMVFKWQKLDDGTVRAPVFGGWIVEVSDSYQGHVMMSTVFVPDPDHNWKVDVIED